MKQVILFLLICIFTSCEPTTERIGCGQCTEIAKSTGERCKRTVCDYNKYWQHR